MPRNMDSTNRSFKTVPSSNLISKHQHRATCYDSDAQESYFPPIKPSLHLFPRGDPDAPFTPLKTRAIFSTAPRQPIQTYRFESDSSDGEYDSTDNEEEGEEEVIGEFNAQANFTTTFSLSKDLIILNAQTLTDMTRSISPQIITHFNGGRKSSLKSPFSSDSSTPTSSSSRSRSSSQSSSFSSNFLSNDDENFSTRKTKHYVQIVEPIRDLLELRSLRRQFGKPIKINHHLSGFGLPSSPKDGLKKKI